MIFLHDIPEILCILRVRLCATTGKKLPVQMYVKHAVELHHVVVSSTFLL